MLRMTVHYDQDALDGIAPLSVRGDLLGTVNGTEYRFPSDNDFNKGEIDENGDGNPENDSTPLPGLRLIKSVDVLPGPVAFDGVDDAYDAVFGFRIENTGGVVLQDLAMADLFLENAAVTEILDVEILSLETSSESFTAAGLPDAFVGLNSVQRFEGGDAILQPGEDVLVTARVFFRLDESKTNEPILNRAAAFARVDVDGDGELDTVLGDPADTKTTLGVDADGDGEEGNDAAPVGFGRLQVATEVAGEIDTQDVSDFLLLTATTTVTNIGTAPLGNVTVDQPMPETLFVEFIDLLQPATVTLAPTKGSVIPGPLTYDGISDTRPIDDMPTLLPGESFAFTVGYRFLANGIDPLALTDLRAEGEGTVDRDGDGSPDFAVSAVVPPTALAEEGGVELIENLLQIQLGAQVAATIAPAIGDQPAEAQIDGGETSLAVTTTDQDVSASLSTTGFMPATDGEVLIPETPVPAESSEAALAAIEETLQAVDEVMIAAAADAEAEPMMADNDFDSNDDFVADEFAEDDFPTDDFAVDDFAADDFAADDFVVDDVMIDDAMTLDEELADAFDDGDFADFSDPAEQFEQETMNYGSIEEEETAPALYQAPPVQQQRAVQQPKLVRKLIPGPKIAFPPGSVPVTLTTGFQLAVPQGFQAYQAPDGSFFLMRKQ